MCPTHTHSRICELAVVALAIGSPNALLGGGIENGVRQFPWELGEILIILIYFQDCAKTNAEFV